MSNYLPTQYQEVIAASRYARWNEELNRRETWEETVGRYVTNVVTPALNSDPVLEEEIRQAILNLEVMPSMRMLMCAGPALERDHMAGYNCLVGSTKVITKEYGAVRLDEITGQTVTTLTPAGWKEANANYFGEKPTQRITFKPHFDRTNHRVVVEATPDHKWILATGGHTRNLQVGDKVNSLVAPAARGQDYDDGVRHGIVFGDGSLNKRMLNGRYQHHVRLCGRKAEEMAGYFSSISYPESYNGDAVGYWTCSVNCKEFPENKSTEYLAGFLWGWMLADGNQLDSDSIKLDTQKEGAYEWLLDNSAVAGYVVVGIHYNNKPTNFGERSNPLARITLKKSKEFVVESIHELEVQDTYCLTVPEEGCFALASGLLTGNCSFLAVDHPRAFDEILYILTCGTGVGFSCETQFVNKLPEVAESFHDTDTTIVVADSRIGWASSFRELLSLLWAGKIPRVDASKVRAKGERLKTFGGRASGPAPLVDLFDYCVRVFRNAAGRRLSDIEVHGIVCKIGEVVVVGGVRRSALISLSDLHSNKMRHAKSGNWWERSPEFALANNSAVYETKPDVSEFLEEWKALYDSKSGERGIYYRKGIRDKTRRIGRRDDELIVGTNPCGEIALRSAGLCNLTEVVVRCGDSFHDLARKVRLATILGTIQSTYTDFRYVRNVWKRNAEEERLLGVSLTGIYDNVSLSTPGRELCELLEQLKAHAVEVNVEWATRLGISPSVAVTTIKPSGTVSQLVDSASGIHPRHSEYYIRAIRQDNKDPLTQFLSAEGVPSEPDVMKPNDTTVFYFPVKSPNGAMVRKNITPRTHLDLWNIYNRHWAEHQVSVTVSVADKEWVDTAAWVYDNFDDLSGISFLPYDGGTYRQAPYQECTKEQYEELVHKMPEFLDWSMLSTFETEDTTTGSHELACTGGQCEVTW